MPVSFLYGRLPPTTSRQCQANFPIIESSKRQRKKAINLFVKQNKQMPIVLACELAGMPNKDDIVIAFHEKTLAFQENYY